MSKPPPKNLSPYVDALLAPDGRGKVVGKGPKQAPNPQPELPTDFSHTKPLLCPECFGRGRMKKGKLCGTCKGRGVVPNEMSWENQEKEPGIRSGDYDPFG